VTKHKVALLTREYPPEVYGGAGVHVEYLARELRLRTELSVHCWGSPRDEAGVTAHQPWTALSDPNPAAFQAMSINLAMAAADWMLIVNQRHLEAVLHEYCLHDNDERPHRSRNLRPPASCGDPIAPSDAQISRTGRLSGLLSEYRRVPVAA